MSALQEKTRFRSAENTAREVPDKRPRRPRYSVYARAIALLMLAAGLLAGIWGFAVEPDLLRIRQVTVASPFWPQALPDLRIVAISDIHAGSPYIDEAKLDRIVAESNRLDPDVVVLLGDFVIEHVAFGQFMPPEVIASHLRGLKARRGVFAVLGNHDWQLDGPRVRRALVSAGIDVLENEAAPLPDLAPPVWMVGLADFTTRTPNIAAAYAPVPADAAVIALMHDPSIFPAIPAGTALSLAGHTHGGQVSLPWIGPLYLPAPVPRRYAAGLVHEDGKDLFVTTGIGTSILGIRLNVPPEIVEITLTART